MNRETPEFDPVGLFVVATAGGAPCSGYTHFFLSDAKLIHLIYICNNISWRYFWGTKKVRKY